MLNNFQVNDLTYSFFANSCKLPHQFSTNPNGPFTARFAHVIQNKRQKLHNVFQGLKWHPYPLLIYLISSIIFAYFLRFLKHENISTLKAITQLFHLPNAYLSMYDLSPYFLQATLYMIILNKIKMCNKSALPIHIIFLYSFFNHETYHKLMLMFTYYLYVSVCLPPNLNVNSLISIAVFPITWNTA